MCLKWKVVKYVILLQKQDDCQQESLKSAPADMEGELLINMVSRAVTAIMARLNTLSNFDGTESKVQVMYTTSEILFTLYLTSKATQLNTQCNFDDV